MWMAGFKLLEGCGCAGWHPVLLQYLVHTIMYWLHPRRCNTHSINCHHFRIMHSVEQDQLLDLQVAS